MGLRKYLFSLLFLILAGALSANAQSTTVSGQVTDAGGQSWNNGTVTVNFITSPGYPAFPQYVWTGGALSFSVSGTLNATGGYSISVPSSTAITPGGSTWQLKFCPQATAFCFTTSTVTITGGTQTINATPPAIAISMANPPPNTTAYADNEIIGAVVGQSYFNLTTGAVRTCTALPCTANVNWISNGGPISASVNVPCASSLSLPFQAGAQITDFYVNLNCNVTSSTITNLSSIPTGGEVVLVITQTNNFSFAFPPTFTVGATPAVPPTAGVVSASTWQYCGTAGVGASCPALQWQNTDQGPASYPLIVTVQNICTSPITSGSVTASTLTILYNNAVGNCGTVLVNGSTFTLFGITGGTNCNDVFFTVTTNSSGTATMPAGGCSGSFTGGFFSNQANAVYIANAGNTAANGLANAAVILDDPDGTVWLQARSGTNPCQQVQLDTTGRVRMWSCTGGGFGMDETGGPCIIILAASIPCNSGTNWSWNNSGHLAQMRGKIICNAGATGNCVDTPPQAYASPTLSALSGSLGTTLLFTTFSGLGVNDHTTILAAGKYELVYWARSTAANAGQTLQWNLLCTDDGGTIRTYSGPVTAFATTGAVASGVIVCYSEAGVAINESITIGTPGATPTYNAEADLFEK